MTIANVAILGISGRLGPYLLNELVESKKFTVTVLLRPESSARVPEKFENLVKTETLPSDFKNDSNGLTKVLKGQDAVVASIPATMLKEQMALAEASLKAGVRRFVPADFGSVDSSDQVCADLVPLYGSKITMRDSLKGFSMLYPNFSWTSLVCGHFFDYGLVTPLLGYDLKSSPPSAIIYDSGDTKWSASTRRRIGQALVAALVHEDETRNKMIYVQSFSTTQNEILALLEKTSGQKFQVETSSSEEAIKEKKKEVDEGRGHDPMELLVGILGMTRAYWEDKPDFANGILGLEPENLEEEIKKAWEARG